ncbi:uncharacterized protein EAF02_000915 [Botrytis sinoallii]|uniref:uncharacterized protein n=1 Tax=Botrytis sinoallii TaxID=1463999 RepID=UPI001900DFE7|nr:uncharacterized protein EAF02_000915 [Botrytis sinoallii]KAF7893377.1 hypothetical protein EAF02_000915 [Botrytis sinoallii]
MSRMSSDTNASWIALVSNGTLPSSILDPILPGTSVQVSASVACRKKPHAARVDLLLIRTGHIPPIQMPVLAIRSQNNWVWISNVSSIAKDSFHTCVDGS